MSYFWDWQKELHEYRRYHDGVAGKKVLKRYLSEETFDNLRLMYYGFKGYTKFFFDTFPRFYLTPQRICTNSPLESIFGCLKFMRGKMPLTGSNYSDMMARLNWVTVWKCSRAQSHVGPAAVFSPAVAAAAVPP